MRTIEMLSSRALNCGVPQRITTTLRISQGIHALTTSARGGVTGASAVGPASGAPSVACRPRGTVVVQIFCGRQYLRKAIRQPIDTTDARTSTSQGPLKFEIRYCGMAKLTP